MHLNSELGFQRFRCAVEVTLLVLRSAYKLKYNFIDFNIEKCMSVVNLSDQPSHT